jgi:hypothetical protein
LNISIFNQAIKELSIKYTMQDIDVINHLVKSAENIFNTPLQIIYKDDDIFLIKISDGKRINLTPNTLKKISKIFDANLQDSNKRIQINEAKKLLSNKTVILFEILKKLDTCFICSFKNLIAILPFKNIPDVDFEKYILGSKHYGIVHSYSFSKEEIILNCKHSLVEIKKVSSIILNLNITKVNRYYGQRVKIYANEVPVKAIINNLKMIYPKEKLIFFKDLNEK